MLSYIKIFFYSGFIIALMAVSIKYFEPKYAAIIYALPVEFLMVIFFIKEDKKQKNMIIDSLKSTRILLLFFILLTFLILFINPIYSLIISSLFFSLLGYKYLKKNNV